MKIEFTGRKIEITPALRRFTEEKLQKLSRVLDGIIETHVILRVEKHRHSAEILVHSAHATLSGSETTSDLYASIGKVLEKIERQAKKHKEKFTSGKKRGKGIGEMRIAAAPPPPAELVTSAAVRPRVIRTRRYAVKPMTVDEAVLQVESTRDSFLVFRDAGNERVQIVYRRADGNFGLIEPEL